MGLTTAIDQAGPVSSERNSLSPPSSNMIQTVHTVCPSSNPDEIMLNYIKAISSVSTAHPSLLPLSGGLPRHVPPPVPSPPPGTASAPMPSATTRRHRTSLSSTTSEPRRRGLLRARARRVRTLYERAMNEFAALENRRLQLEADRERNLHERELERLRLESRRLEIEENHNEILNRLSGTVDKLMEILPQLRPSSLPQMDNTS